MAYHWPRPEWAVLLVPYRSGQALSAYVAMDVNEAMDYDRVKEAVLSKYEINEEVYQRRFDLKDLFTKWIQPVTKTINEVLEVLILEQFLQTLAGHQGLGEGAQSTGWPAGGVVSGELPGTAAGTQDLPGGGPAKTCSSR